MARVGYFLSSEEFSPRELVEQAKMAQDAGFHALWISDHYHPWTEEQGEASFVWATIGALSQAVELPITTAVTCPTVRMHPAVVAQAAATAAVLTNGRFTLGVGSGEALNEHILGTGWPASTAVRLEMLEEAVEVIRRLWTGETVNHRGKHYTVEGARLFTVPPEPPRIFVSGFGPKAATLAGRLGDGYVSTFPDADLLGAFRKGGGAGKPTQAGLKVCWGPDRAGAARTAHRLWATELLPGELAQMLPLPAHFEQANSLVDEEAVAQRFPCGNDPQEHLRAITEYFDAGFDEVYVGQMGPDQKGFFDFYSREILPQLAAPTE
ncbi:TIGR03557 family F420-dependent LLM class oxidoreductase [Actinospica robiniae]|uniref:TIGR03557 family F420-dependent LLM class oxidoreductase n=1 Tax=Actinospica robiniae TaxID=304901 RepID=UPI000401E551|nr:TIGR03557 family F420-dependent LLM class oxidoreductase [Actinospica robiniae]